MKIAIISDIHENFHNLIRALEEIKEKEAEQVVFLGDFINAGIAIFLAEFSIPVFAIWGNNDGDKVVITKRSLEKGSNLSVSENTYDFLELDGKKIFVTHHPELAEPMAKSGEFDAVFYGHDHYQYNDKINDCIVANPGEISAHKTGKATYAIYDTIENKVDFFEIDKSITTKTDVVSEYFEKINIHK